jgi:hypothetical protein
LITSHKPENINDAEFSQLTSLEISSKWTCSSPTDDEKLCLLGNLTALRRPSLDLPIWDPDTEAISETAPSLLKDFGKWKEEEFLSFLNSPQPAMVRLHCLTILSCLVFFLANIMTSTPEETQEHWRSCSAFPFRSVHRD